MSIGERLRHERERVGLTQAACAALAGKSERSQVDWEKDVAAPNARVLEAFAAKGMDVCYIVTGRVWGAAPGFEPLVLGERERRLIENYRSASEQARAAIDAMAAATGSTVTYGAHKATVHQTFHGQVGSVQSVHEGTINVKHVRKGKKPPT